MSLVWVWPVFVLHGLVPVPADEEVAEWLGHLPVAELMKELQKLWHFYLGAPVLERLHQQLCTRNSLGFDCEVVSVNECPAQVERHVLRKTLHLCRHLLDYIWRKLVQLQIWNNHTSVSNCNIQLSFRSLLSRAEYSCLVQTTERPRICYLSLHLIYQYFTEQKVL